MKKYIAVLLFGIGFIGCGNEHISNTLPNTSIIQYETNQTQAILDDKGSITTNTIKDIPSATSQTIINKAPIAKGLSSANNILSGQSVHFEDNGSYDPDGTIIKYQWIDLNGIVLSTNKAFDRTLYYFANHDLGNGTTQYIKTLYVTDDKGDTATTSFEVIVHKEITTLNEALRINETILNTPPQAISQSIVLNHDTTKIITLIGTDKDGDALTYTITTQPINGILSGTGANLTYTPNTNYSGSDNFSFIVSDDTNDSAPATVNITVTPIALLPENEPYYKYAWHLKSKNNVLKMDYNIDIDDNADINITEAWELTKGKGIKVAIIDTGVDVEHEDLKSNILITYNADDDSSDVSNQSEDLSDSLHGNTCAGFIVAPINGKGSLGVAPEAKLIAIKQETDSISNTIRAFEYAKNQGAKVISCSWGTENVSQAVEDELKSLYDSGITVLFASGNDNKSLDNAGIHDESEVQWVIGVGSSGENNDITSYSNYGENIDILAPGGDTSVIGVLGIDDTGNRGATNQQGFVNNNYTFTSGTSFSTPVTAGVVALMYSVKPTITPAEVKSILIETTEKIGGNEANYNSNGFDEKRAYGKINASKAVLRAKNL